MLVHFVSFQLQAFLESISVNYRPNDGDLVIATPQKDQELLKNGNTSERRAWIGLYSRICRLLVKLSEIPFMYTSLTEPKLTIGTNDNYNRRLMGLFNGGTGMSGMFPGREAVCYQLWKSWNWKEATLLSALCLNVRGTKVRQMCQKIVVWNPCNETVIIGRPSLRDKMFKLHHIIHYI